MSSYKFSKPTFYFKLVLLIQQVPGLPGASLLCLLTTQSEVQSYRCAMKILSCIQLHHL